MKWNALNHLPLLGSPGRVVEVEKTEPPPGKSMADKSYFHPDSAIVATGVGVLPPSAYLFPDGKDTGADMPIAFRKGVDLSELSAAVRSQDEALKSLAAKIAEQRKIQEEIEKLDKANNETVMPASTQAATE